MNPDTSSGIPPLPDDPNKPVAYDQYGRPLYAHPPTDDSKKPDDSSGSSEKSSAPDQEKLQEESKPTPDAKPEDGKSSDSQSGSQTQTVYMARPLDPAPQKISPEIAQKHAESVRKYPSLNLSNGEYIITAVKRHPAGILQIWGVALAMMLTFGLLAMLLMSGESANGGAAAIFADTGSMTGIAMLLLFIVVVLSVLGGFIATYIYNSNRFYLTNESVIQEIRNSILSQHEQTVSLGNIEDASYRQDGFLAHIFGYGTIRLSTEGDETTYRFSYVANPKRHIATLNNAVEAFKNGRPIEW